MSVDVRTNKFRPLELNERNVKAIFKRCLANEDNTKEGVYYSQVLDPEYCGKTSELVRFSKENIDLYTPVIQYLLGQIKAFQDSSRESFALQEGFLRYDDTFWTKDYDVLFKLYALALSSASITNFFSHGELITSAKSPLCVATLLPRDPNFSEWYEGYKIKHPELF